MAALERPLEDFDEQFGNLLESLLAFFPVEDPASTAAHLAQLDPDDHLAPTTDVERVMHTEKRIKDWRNGTKDMVDHAREQLRAIALDYKQAMASSQRSSTVPSATEHQRQLETMFQATVSGMKANSELDQHVMELQGELQRLQDELKAEEADAIEVAELNSEVLRLKLYRDLGFTPIEENGQFDKFLVRSATTSEARTVHLDPSVNDFQWCNFLWNLVEGRAPPPLA
ncbi:hypothetical protein JCM10212_005367 [Sporobolomyces blumeae]